MTRFIGMLVLALLNAGTAILNFYIGGWNILAGIFSLIVCFFCLYVSARIHNNTW